jgi:uncharacterized protein (TIRG00374 family)
MKRILLALFQAAVTVLVLFLVVRNPDHGKESTVSVSSPASVPTDPSSGGFTREKRAWFKFALPEPHAEIKSATLRVFGRCGESLSIDAFAIDAGDWAEKGMTWKKQPDKSGTLLGTAIAQTEAKYLEWDVADFLRTPNTEASGVSLMLASSDPRGSNPNPLRKIEFRGNSRESESEKPELLIAFQGGATQVLAPLADTCVSDTTKLNEMRLAIRWADKIWLLWAFVCFGGVLALAAFRWGLLLRVQGILISRARTTALLMIGLFFNLFMPGGTGGDVVKIFYLIKEAPDKKAAALLATLMDRIIGLVALMLIAVVLTALRYEWLTQTKVTAGLLLTLVLVLVVSLGAVGVSFLVTGMGWLDKLPKKMPGRDKLIEFSKIYHLFASQWKTAATCIGISWLIHIGSFLSFYCAGRSFNITTPLLDFAAIMPIVNTIAALPISLAGVGVREKLFEDLLGQLAGVPEAVAVMISLTGFAATAGWGLIGGLLYLFYRPTQHAKIAKIDAAVHEIEERITRGTDG